MNIITRIAEGKRTAFWQVEEALDSGDFRGVAQAWVALVIYFYAGEVLRFLAVLRGLVWKQS